MWWWLGLGWRQRRPRRVDGLGPVDRASVGDGDGWDLLPSRVFSRTRGLCESGQRVFRQQGGDFNSVLAECNLVCTLLAFCDLDGQIVSSENFLAHSFTHIFIYSASAKHCDRTQKEHKP